MFSRYLHVGRVSDALSSIVSHGVGDFIQSTSTFNTSLNTVNFSCSLLGNNQVAWHGFYTAACIWQSISSTKYQVRRDVHRFFDVRC